MAFKLPTPSIFKSKPTATAAKPSPSTVTPAFVKAKVKPESTSGGLFGSLFKSKKPKENVNNLTGKNSAVSRAASTTIGPETNSGFGGNSAGAISKTQKIAATVAANKTVKQKGKTQNYTLPILGRFVLRTQFQVLGTLVGLFFVLMLAAIALDVKSRGDISTWTNITSQLQFHTQRLAKAAGLAARGDVVAFPQLQDSRDQFQIYVNVLNDGGEAFNSNVPSAKVSSELTSRMEELTRRYETASGHGTSILAAKNDLTNLGRNVAQVRAGSEELAGFTAVDRSAATVRCESGASVKSESSYLLG